jgi:predicted permease
MRWLDKLRLRIRSLFRRGRMDNELERELQEHFQRQIDENIENGMAPEEARLAALRTIGNLTRLKEQCRDERGLNFLDDLRQDFRYALRGFGKNPGFTVMAVMMLALGIGVNTTVFTVTNAMLFSGYPGLDPDGRILYINTQNKNTGRGIGTFYLDYQDWRAHAKSFVDMAIVTNGGLRIRFADRAGDLPDNYDATELSTNTFRMLGQTPILGRDFDLSDEAPGAPPVTILNYRMWATRYRKNSAVIGQTVRINDVATLVIGVMGPDFEFPQHRVDMWIPLSPWRLPLGAGIGTTTEIFQNRRLRFNGATVFGRLANGFTVQQARTEMDALANQLAIAYPETNQNLTARVRTFSETVGPDANLTYKAMWGAVGFVLLIVCANLANLMLARAIGRSREVSLRIALGAGRWRIVRQLLAESAMLSALGGGLGLAVAILGVRMYERIAVPPTSYVQWVYPMDYRVFVYLLAIGLVTGLLFGLVPAVRLSRLDVNTTLKDAGRGSTGGRRGKYLSAVLVIGEMALAVVLLAGAGVMIRSFINIYTANRGMEADKILTADVRLPLERYRSKEARLAFFDRLKKTLQALPGVESVSFADGLPGAFAAQVSFETGDAPTVEEKDRVSASMVTISSGYFRTLGAVLLSGRTVTEADDTAAPPIAVVNDRLARSAWPGEDPIGKRLRVFDGTAPESWRTVVGVVSNIVQNDPTGQRFDPIVYVPVTQRSTVAGIVIVRTSVPPESIGNTFRRTIQETDLNLVIYSWGTLSESLSLFYWSKGVNAGLFLVFAAIGLILAAFGLYAVIAHSIGQQTQEIGVRIAIGASGADIMSMVFKLGMLPVGIGLMLGLAASFAINPVLRSQLAGVSPFDPLTLLAAIAVLVLTGLLGCWIPARRANRVDPVVALKQE